MMDTVIGFLSCFIPATDTLRHLTNLHEDPYVPIQNACILCKRFKAGKKVYINSGNKAGNIIGKGIISSWTNIISLSSTFVQLTTRRTDVF